MRLYTKHEREVFWAARCPECGWSGLTCDCIGFESIADTGDYDDGYCPRCRAIITEDNGVFGYSVLTRLLWLWRLVSFWPKRRDAIERALEERQCRIWEAEWNNKEDSK